MDWSTLETALAAGNYDGALDIALAGWRARRHAAFAELVGAIGAAIAPFALPEQGFHAAWLARAAERRSSELDTLLATLLRRLPRATRVSRWGGVEPDGWVERVGALAAWPDDPRIASVVLGIVRRAPWHVPPDYAERVYREPLALVARIGDERAVPQLEELAAHVATHSWRWPNWLMPASVADAIALIRVASVAVSDDEIARARRMCEQLALAGHARVVADLDDLLAAVRRDPEDIAAREVYADALLETGDVVGEFTSLQLAAARGDITDDGIDRMRSLLRTHVVEWLGTPLHQTLKLVTFEHGLLASAELEANSKASDESWTAAPHDERLATVHTLEKGKGNEAHYSDFVFSPAMSGLRSVTLVSRKMIERTVAAKRPWPFRVIELVRVPPAKQLQALLASPALPELECLSFAVNGSAAIAALPQLAALARDRGLAELRFRTTKAEWYAQTWRAMLAALSTSGVALGFETYDSRVLLRSSANGVEVEAWAGPWSRFGGLSLAMLPAIGKLVIREYRPRHQARLVAIADHTEWRDYATWREEIAPYAPELPAHWR